jgi:hypothetical protein
MPFCAKFTPILRHIKRLPDQKTAYQPIMSFRCYLNAVEKNIASLTIGNLLYYSFLITEFFIV